MSSTTDPEFFKFLKNITTNEVALYAIPEGSVVFAKVPLIRVEGPLAGIINLLNTRECFLDAFLWISEI